MDSGDSSSAPAPAPDYGQMWQDYSTWEADITEHYTSAMADLDLNYKLGRGISPEAYVGERTRLEREMGEELGTLRRGPTYQMLRENWEQQRTFAPLKTDPDMTTFYGGPAPRDRARQTGSLAAEPQASPRRGLAPSGVMAEAESLLERPDSVTWYYV